MKNRYIIKNSEEFNNIIKNGKTIKGKNVSLYYLPSTDYKKYYGIAVSKKIGNAVTRNLLKRRVRMIIHNNQKSFSNNYKYIIMIRRDCLNSKYIDVNNELVNLIGKVK